MKKALALLLLALIIQSAFSANYINSIMGVSYRPLTMRYKAMGESGIAIATKDEALFINASALSDADEFSLELPALSLSLTEAKDILTSPIGKIMEGDEEAILDTAAILNGTFPLLLLEESIATSFKHFAIGLHFRESLYSTGESFATGFIPALQSTLSFGYGHKFKLSDDISLKLGAAQHISGVFYSSEISAEAAVDLIKGDTSNIELNSSSWNFSTDIGTTLVLPKGFSFGIVINDISSGINFVDKNSGKRRYSYSAPNIALGSAWQCDFGKKSSLALSYDTVNLIHLFKNLSFSSLLYHTNFGVELNIYDVLSLYGGLAGGYPSFGMEANIFFIKLSMLYRYMEFGDEVGINPKDQLEVRLALSF